MIEICLNTDVFMRFPLAQALELTARAGYRSITLNAIPSWEPHLDLNSAEAAAHVRELAELLERNGLAIKAVEAGTNLAAWDRTEREHAQEYCTRVIESLAPLGCHHVCLSAPGTNLLGIAEQQALFLGSLVTLSGIAASCGTTLSVEIYPGSCLEKTTDAVRLLDAMGAPNVGYHLCIPHVAALGEDLLQAYRTAKRHLRHLHLADSPSSTVSHQHLVPGDGTVDFLPLLTALAQDGFDGNVTVQIYSCVDTAFESAVRALAATRRLLELAGLPAQS